MVQSMIPVSIQNSKPDCKWNYNLDFYMQKKAVCEHKFELYIYCSLSIECLLKNDYAIIITN